MPNWHSIGLEPWHFAVANLKGFIMAKKAIAVKTTVRTSAGLCDALFDEFDMLRNGQSDAHRAAAVAKLAIQIVATKRLEIDAAALIKGGLDIRSIMFENKSVRLGLQ